MSEFTTWVPADLVSTGNLAGTAWSNLPAAEVDNNADAFASAIFGSWEQSVTRVISVNGRTGLGTQIPDSAEIEAVEVRFYFQLTTELVNIGAIDVIQSQSATSHVVGSLIGSIGPGIENVTMVYTKTVTTPQGRAIAEGGLAVPMFGQRGGDEGSAWELDWRFAEVRLQFTRAPNVPRTAYIALF
jgi:hypothetical protein